MKILAGTIFLVLSFGLQAAPGPLNIDSKQSPKSSDSKILSVHEPINNPGSVAHARATILNAMLHNKGVAWLMEEEGDGYIRGRFDYRGNMILVDVEYSDKYIQLKYVDGFKEFECENNVSGICYENHRHYYNYTKRLRDGIKLGL